MKDPTTQNGLSLLKAIRYTEAVYSEMPNQDHLPITEFPYMYVVEPRPFYLDKSNQKMRRAAVTLRLTISFPLETIIIILYHKKLMLFGVHVVYSLYLIYFWP